MLSKATEKLLLEVIAPLNDLVLEEPRPMKTKEELRKEVREYLACKIRTEAEAYSRQANRTNHLETFEW